MAACSDATNPPPQLTELVPNKVSTQSPTRVIVTGEHLYSEVRRFAFDTPAPPVVNTVFWAEISGNELPSDTVRSIDSRRLELTIPQGLSVGNYDLTVTIPDGRSATLVNAFSVDSCTDDCPNPMCGDGSCSATEDPCTCPVDCSGVCEGICGDGICGDSEDENNCPEDCQTCSTGCDLGVCTESCGPGCSLECLGTCECRVDCTSTGGNCRASCHDNTACHFDCSNSSACLPTCDGNSSCDINCVDGKDCKIDCIGNANCLVNCNGALACRFNECTGQERTCSNRIIVCNRDCP
ncbi:MAG: hypothetical protein JKY56_24580 [Kofleriaceae bacterium]|nr:hypothetical protein [Kofleriaceae bacterium]